MNTIPNCDPIFEIFDTEFFSIFSLQHFNHYLSAIEIFKDNKLFGIGPKIIEKFVKTKNIT